MYVPNKTNVQNFVLQTVVSQLFQSTVQKNGYSIIYLWFYVSFSEKEHSY